MSNSSFRAAEELVRISNLPASMNGSVVLYTIALASVMAISVLGALVCGWMVRDTWRDRFNVHPKSVMFAFRAMMGTIGFTALLRSLPEVLYLQAYNDPDVSLEWQGFITNMKRMADGSAIWFVLLWTGLLVMIYPHITLALKSGPTRAIVLDPLGTWPRLVRPAGIFLCIIVVSFGFAYAKTY